MEEVVNIGIDAGYGYFKAGRVIKDKVHLVSTAAVFGVGDTELGALTGVLEGRRGIEPKKVTFDGQTLLVGENVPRWAIPIQRTDFGRFWEITNEFLALLYAVWSGLLPPGPHTVNLLLGLPISLTISSEARSLAENIRGKLCREHDFQVGKKRYKVFVQSCLIAPQPLGAYYAWLFNEDGSPAQTKDLAEALVGVCDIGYNTSDLFAIEGGVPVKRYIGGIQLGVHNVALMVSEQLATQTGHNFSPAELEPYIRGDKETMILAGKSIDVAGLRRQAVEVVGTKIIEFINGKWGDAPFAKLLIVGGGAYIFGERLRRQYPFAEIPRDPVMYNALGFTIVAHFKASSLFK
jgi:hypothetical protein